MSNDLLDMHVGWPDYVLDYQRRCGSEWPTTNTGPSKYSKGSLASLPNPPHPQREPHLSERCCQRFPVIRYAFPSAVLPCIAQGKSLVIIPTLMNPCWRIK